MVFLCDCEIFANLCLKLYSGHGHCHSGDTSYQQQRSALLGAGAGDQSKTVDGTQALTDTSSEEDTDNK